MVGMSEASAGRDMLPGRITRTTCQPASLAALASGYRSVANMIWEGSSQPSEDWMFL